MNLILKLLGMEKLSNIKISDEFKKTSPKTIKMFNRITYYFTHKCKFKVPIVLDKNNVLIDGYTSYLIAKECKIKIVPVKRADK